MKLMNKYIRSKIDTLIIPPFNQYGHFFQSMNLFWISNI
jgi:hypothetical protein